MNLIFFKSFGDFSDQVDFKFVFTFRLFRIENFSYKVCFKWKLINIFLG